MSVSIYSAFSPNAVIDSIQDFAGRQPQLEKAAIALSMKGASIVVFGYRGVGKSSLAQQIRNIATGDEATIARLPEHLQHDFAFITFFISAAYAVSNTNQAIIALLASDDVLRSYLTAQQAKRVDEIRAQAAIKLTPVKDIIEVSTEIGSARAVEHDFDRINASVFDIFSNAIRNCFRQTNREILIFIDEFDKIADKSGFGDFIKSCELLPIRFVLVGIAQDIAGLLDDHESAARLIRDGLILVPPMTKREQEEIFAHVHEKLQREYEFSVDARNFIIECSQGHPYIVHKLGHESLLVARRRGFKVVTLSIAKAALKEITKDPAAFDLESQFRKAVKDSAHREYILKAFAQGEGDEIRTKTIYRKIVEEADIQKESISTFTGHLMKEEYGSPLIRVRHGVYRFRDRIFKAYCAFRPYEFWNSGED